MKCPNCRQKIPDFLIPSFNNRKQMCPHCMTYHSAKEQEESDMSAERRLKRKQEIAELKAAKAEYKLQKEKSKYYMDEGVEEGIYKIEMGPGKIRRLGSAVKSTVVSAGTKTTTFFKNVQLGYKLAAQMESLADKLEEIDQRS